MPPQIVPVLLIGIAFCVLTSIGTGRLYIRQTRTHRWAYGVRDGFIRWHFGTRSTHSDALEAIQRWMRKDDQSR